MNPFEFIKPIIDFYVDETKKVSSKFVTVLIIIVSLFVLDEIFGFVYYYDIDKKIEYSYKFNKILNDDEISVETKNYFRKEQKKTLNRVNVKDYLFRFLFSINFNDHNIFGLDKTEYDRKKILWENEKRTLIGTKSMGFGIQPKHVKRNIWIDILTSCFINIFIIITILIFFNPVIVNSGKIEDFMGLILYPLSYFIFHAWVEIQLFSHIPVILDPVLNYVLNIILCIIYNIIFTYMPVKLYRDSE